MIEDFASSLASCQPGVLYYLDRQHCKACLTPEAKQSLYFMWKTFTVDILIPRMTPKLDLKGVPSFQKPLVRLSQ